MCSQLFRCCKLDNILVDVPECSFGIIDNAGFFDKVIYRKGGEEFGSSVGGKYVVSVLQNNLPEVQNCILR